jgi:hypothetical protein
LRFASFHVRVVAFTEELTGWFALAMSTASPPTNRPMLALIAVFPFPNRSYAASTRGLMSDQHGRHSMASNDRAGAKAQAGRFVAGAAALR